MKYRCRCLKNKCRRTFTKHPDDMGSSAPECGCGERRWHIDQYRQRVGSKENRTCHCDGVHTKSGRPIKPHRWGCEGCVHREDAVLNAALRGNSTAGDESWLNNTSSELLAP